MPGHEAEVAGFLSSRDPAASPSTGITMRCVGRRLSRHQPAHVVVTCWQDEEAFTQGTDPLGVPADLSPMADLLAERRSSAFRVAAALGQGSERSQILRVYRAQVAVSSVGQWARRAAEQLIELSAREPLLWARAGVGLAGPDPGGEVPVVAVSAWGDWEAVLAATGGHIDRLVQATELVDLERPSGLDHYEVLGLDPRSSADEVPPPRPRRRRSSPPRPPSGDSATPAPRQSHSRRPDLD